MDDVNHKIAQTSNDEQEKKNLLGKPAEEDVNSSDEFVELEELSEGFELLDDDSDSSDTLENDGFDISDVGSSDFTLVEDSSALTNNDEDRTKKSSCDGQFEKQRSSSVFFQVNLPNTEENLLKP